MTSSSYVFKKKCYEVLKRRTYEIPKVGSVSLRLTLKGDYKYANISTCFKNKISETSMYTEKESTLVSKIKRRVRYLDI